MVKNGWKEKKCNQNGIKIDCQTMVTLNIIKGVIKCDHIKG